MNRPNSGPRDLDFYLLDRCSARVTDNVECSTFAHVPRLIDWVARNLRDLLRGEIRARRISREVSFELKFFPYLGEFLDRKFQVFFRMSGGDLGSDAGGPLWHNWVKESDNIDSQIQKSIRHFL